MTSLVVNDSVPKIFKPLDDPYRYKVMWGGRGSAKSWSVARKVVVRMLTRPNYKVLCTRELQKSIKNSVHALLKLQIYNLIGRHVTNVELNPPNLPECLSADAMHFVKSNVIVVHQRAVEVDIIIGVGNSVRGPCWLEAVGTEPDHIALVHEYLDGTGFIQIFRRPSP